MNSQPIQARYTSPDWTERVVLYLVRWRAQMPGWRLETMARLVTSEVEGIKIIEQVLAQVVDPDIRRLLQKHLEDEYRHAQVFSQRYHQLLKEAGQPLVDPPSPVENLQPFSLLSLIAYLETQEARAIPLLLLYARLYEGDQETVDTILRNIRDEKFHAAWTHHQLELWIKEGRGEDVKRARQQAKNIDRQAFWMQCGGFLRTLPRLLARGVLPPISGFNPAPLQ